MGRRDRAETIFSVEATPMRFGSGVALEAGWDLRRFGVKRTLIVTDRGVLESGIVEPIVSAVRADGIEAEIYSDVCVEPTAASFEHAAAHAAQGSFDGFLSIGGGSSIDTAKVANLMSCEGGELMDFVNPPIGIGRKPAGPLRPHVALPTTSGSGSEATSVAVLEVEALHLKTGISHRVMRPSQALLDPRHLTSLPAGVVAATGLDVVCHAAESYVARPFTSRTAPHDPADRPPYQGSNPISDVWSARALEYSGRYLRRAFSDPEDSEARGAMMLAASLAGIGYGSAGVHIPHACGYPIASLRHDYEAAGYPSGRALTPHGYTVIVTAPAAFAFTFDSCPERHIRAARLLAGEDAAQDGAHRDALPRALDSLMKDLEAPVGLADLGYHTDDIPALIAGALKQQRLLDIAPHTPTEEDLDAIFRRSMQGWEIR